MGTGLQHDTKVEPIVEAIKAIHKAIKRNDRIAGQKRTWQQRAEFLKRENDTLRLQIFDQKVLLISAERAKFHINKLIKDSIG